MGKGKKKNFNRIQLVVFKFLITRMMGKRDKKNLNSKFTKLQLMVLKFLIKNLTVNAVNSITFRYDFTFSFFRHEFFKVEENLSDINVAIMSKQ